MEDNLPSKKGRKPYEYHEEVGDIICEELAKGKSLTRIRKERPEVPSLALIYRWLENNVIFREKYTKARELQAHHYLDEILDIANNAVADIREAKHGPEINKPVILRAKLQIDTYKWVMGKLNGKYSDKQVVEHIGDSSGVNIHVDASRRESREEYEKRINSIETNTNGSSEPLVSNSEPALSTQAHAQITSSTEESTSEGESGEE
jgi:hypothetical protein